MSMIRQSMGIDEATGKDTHCVYGSVPQCGGYHCVEWDNFVAELVSQMPPTTLRDDEVSDKLRVAIERLYADTEFTWRTHRVAYETRGNQIRLRLEAKPLPSETITI